MGEKAEIINTFWENFLLKTNRDKDIKYIDSFHFELTKRWADELLRLVLQGKNKQHLVVYWPIKLEEIEFLISIVTDWEGIPKCVIETTNVMIIPFKEITFDICKLEGEDDNLESWREGHISFFSREGKELGYTFTEDMPVIFENFKMVFSE